jgi:hypothetical protein
MPAAKTLVTKKKLRPWGIPLRRGVYVGRKVEKRDAKGKGFCDRTGVYGEYLLPVRRIIIMITRPRGGTSSCSTGTLIKEKGTIRYGTVTVTGRPRSKIEALDSTGKGAAGFSIQSWCRGYREAPERHLCPPPVDSDHWDLLHTGSTDRLTAFMIKCRTLAISHITRTAYQ